MVLLHCWCFACNARLVFIQHQEGEHVWCILFLCLLGCLFRLLYADAAHLSCWHRAPHTKGASEGTIRGIVAGTHPSALYERYKSEGAARFKNSISTGPFKDEEEQVEPVVDVLREWFPGREHFTLVDEVLLEEALRLVVMKINDVDADAAKAFMERKQWLTSQERRALAKSKPANGTNSTLSSSSADSSGVE